MTFLPLSSLTCAALPVATCVRTCVLLTGSVHAYRLQLWAVAADIPTYVSFCSVLTMSVTHQHQCAFELSCEPPHEQHSSVSFVVTLSGTEMSRMPTPWTNAVRKGLEWYKARPTPKQRQQEGAVVRSVRTDRAGERYDMQICPGSNLHLVLAMGLGQCQSRTGTR